jgi:hypothetical protein
MTHAAQGRIFNAARKLIGLRRNRTWWAADQHPAGVRPVAKRKRV